MFFSIVILFGVIISTPEFLFAGSDNRDIKISGEGATYSTSVDEVLTQQTNYALIIAINKYKGKIPSLDTPVNDAREIRNILVNKYGFDPKNVMELYDDEANRANILHKLRDFARDLGEHDNLIVYFAGHGQLDDVTGTGHWVPSDAIANKFDTYIPNSTIRDYIQAIKARHVYLISDSCFSGSLMTERAIPSEVSDRYYRESARRASRQVLTSGGKEPVADAGAEGHSIFAYYLIKVFQNHETNYIVPSEIFSELKLLVAGNSNQTPIQGPLRGTLDEGGEMVFRNQSPNPNAISASAAGSLNPPAPSSSSLSMKRTAKSYRTAAITLTAVSGVSLIAGGAFYLLSDSVYKNDFQNATTKSKADSAKSKGKGYEIGAEACGAIAIAAAGGAIYFWLANPPKKHAEFDKPWYVVSPASDGRYMGLMIQGVFK